MEVIPAIDLLGGRCVRLFQGDFGQVVTYGETPAAIAARYRAAGLNRLHLVDLDGARTGDPANGAVIAAIAGSGVRVQAGGGVRTSARLHALLAAGADRVVVGSVAVEEPATALAWLRETGPDGLVLAFDVRLPPGADPIILTRGWQKDSGLSLWQLTETYLTAGARHFLCTDVSRDGTLTGPNLSLYQQCTSRFPEAAFIASGGVSTAADLPSLAATGVAAVVTGKALLDGRLTLGEISSFLRDA